MESSEQTSAPHSNFKHLQKKNVQVCKNNDEPKNELSTVQAPNAMLKRKGHTTNLIAIAHWSSRRKWNRFADSTEIPLSSYDDTKRSHNCFWMCARGHSSSTFVGGCWQCDDNFAFARESLSPATAQRSDRHDRGREEIYELLLWFVWIVNCEYHRERESSTATTAELKYSNETSRCNRA